jgi:hypothetical protein
MHDAPSTELVNGAYKFLLADAWVIVLLVFGGLVDLAVIAAVPVPSIVLGTSSLNAGPFDWINVLTLAVAVGVTTSVTVVVTGAATAAALIRGNGGVPTARAVLAILWSRGRPQAAWALVIGAVAVFCILLSRFGIAGVTAQMAATIGWAAATLFAVPIVMRQGAMPTVTVRESGRMVRANFVAVAHGGIKLAAPWAVAGIGAVLEAAASSFVLFVADAHPSGILVFVALFCLGAGVLFSAGVVGAGLAAYLNTILFGLRSPRLSGCGSREAGAVVKAARPDGQRRALMRAAFMFIETAASAYPKDMTRNDRAQAEDPDSQQP